ncbi:methyltransferase type 12 [Pseudonocardia sp. CNS-139]|nr:methyltransferase type 12 [Pseudonocardia sp. CNS-139]
MPTSVFDPALAGAAARLVRADGVELDLAVQRWHAPAGGEDDWLLDRCAGPAIDLGCGPGRLVAALTRRGVRALGVDVSRVAHEQCRRRGVPMVRRDVFARLPDEGRWQHVLLADGNIGIGGDPLRLLRRAAQLVRPGGTVLVEADGRPHVYWCGTVWLHTGAGAGTPVPWAGAGVAALARIAAAAGLRASAVYRGGRTFVELRRSLPSANAPARRPSRPSRPA